MQDLHACGLGYRSPYLHGTLRALRAGLDLEALHCSLGTGRAEAERTLQRLPGVGPKVAACVALYGCHGGEEWGVEVGKMF